MEEKAKSNRRRRERALKMRAEISESAKASEDSCEESVPRVRTKPPRPRKKNKEPLFEEDVVEGFAFLAFKNYEDLEVSGRAAVGGRAAEPARGHPTQGRRGRAGLNTAVLRDVVLGNNGGARHATHRPPPRQHKGGIRTVPPACNSSLPHMLPQHAAVHAPARRPEWVCAPRGGSRAMGRHPCCCLCGAPPEEVITN